MADDRDGPFRVYVAGSVAELDKAREAMATLRKHGIRVTHDWVADVDADGALPNDERVAKACACADLRGVRTADLVWVLTPADRSRGSGLWVELGAALIIGIPVIISGPQCYRSVFTTLCYARYEDHASGIAAVMAAAHEKLHGDPR